MAPSQGTHVLISGDEPRLVAALDEALRHSGWATIRVAAGSDLPASGQFLHVVVLTGSILSLCLLPEGIRPILRTVAVGPRTAARNLSIAVVRGAVAVIDSDQPFLEVLDQLDAALRGVRLPARPDVMARLHDHEQRSTALARLTPSEALVLARLVEGRTAGEIANAAHVSLATVRTHIRRILGKLDVTSQVGAIATAHRYADTGPVRDAIREVHQF